VPDRHNGAPDISNTYQHAQFDRVDFSGLLKNMTSNS
jgi:hypothetical protein